MAPQQLVFAGVLLPGSQPMRCREGSCTPQLPLQLQVSAVASRSASTLGLPQARVARGSCRVEAHRALCEARDEEGRSWRAQARW